MRLASIKYHNSEIAVITVPDGHIPIAELNRLFKTSWPETVIDLIKAGLIGKLQDWFRDFGYDELTLIQKILLKPDDLSYAPLYCNPGKIWGIGLNYSSHAADLSEKTPKGIPASFVKTNTTLIGYQDTIQLPRLSTKVTGEAELGIVIGKEVRNISAENWLEAVAGFTAIIDMTAEDILRQNPRYLTLSKNFDTFFSLGPQLVTPDEIPNLEDLWVSTVKNGQTIARNQVSQMTFSPSFLVSFHSQVMTLQPGDIISSGTPGAAELNDGDTIECRIEGFETLTNPVTDLKRS